jgi:hypothetical protein
LTLIPLLSGQGLPWTVTMIQDMFPLLLGQIVGYGAVLGLGYYHLAGHRILVLIDFDEGTQPLRRFGFLLNQ